MKLAARRAPLLALAAAATAAPACAGDDADGGVDDIVVYGRAPCGARGQWNDGIVQTTRFVNDERRHPVETVTTAPDGAVIYRILRGWDRDRLLWSDYASDARSHRSDFEYDAAGRTTTVTRTDRALDDGDDGFVIRYGYDDGAMVTSDLDWADPDRADTHTTITGHRTRLETSIECLVDDPTSCDTWVFEQPDRDPRHWTAGWLDYGSDGIQDYELARTLDRHGLELTYVETDVQLGEVQLRVTTPREADGTELGSISEYFDAEGAPWDTFLRENDFVCASTRAARVRRPHPAEPFLTEP